MEHHGEENLVTYLVVTVYLVVRPPALLTNGPSAPQAIATQMQLKVYLEGNHTAARTFRKKKQQQSRVFFDVIFDIYNQVDNKERARARD